MTDDGSRPLTPAEVSTLTAEVNDLVASIAPSCPTPPLNPRAPWMVDANFRPDAEADAAWQSSSETLLPSTICPVLRSMAVATPTRGPTYGPQEPLAQDAQAVHHLVADLLDASVNNWYQDPDADVDLPIIPPPIRPPSCSVPLIHTQLPRRQAQHVHLPREVPQPQLLCFSEHRCR
jgi:hypothetical protein